MKREKIWNSKCIQEIYWNTVKINMNYNVIKLCVCFVKLNKKNAKSASKLTRKLRVKSSASNVINVADRVLLPSDKHIHYWCSFNVSIVTSIISKYLHVYPNHAVSPSKSVTRWCVHWNFNILCVFCRWKIWRIPSQYSSAIKLFDRWNLPGFCLTFDSQ